MRSDGGVGGALIAAVCEAVSTRRSNHGTLWFAAIAALSLLTFSGCATAPSGKHRDASLSDAVRAAKGEHVRIPAAHSRGDDDLAEIGRQRIAIDTADAAFQESAAPHADGEDGFGFEYSAIRYTWGPLDQGRFYALYRETLGRDREGALGYRIIYGTYHLSASGLAGGAIVSATSIGVDGFMKLYGTNNKFVTAPYLLFSAGVGNMMWNYRQPITDSSGYTFNSDSLEYMELKAGVGGELGHYGVMQLSVYAGPVVRIYLGRTQEGFNNDLFGDRADLTWGATIGLRY